MKYIAPSLVLLASCFLILQAFVRSSVMTDDWFLPLILLAGGVVMLVFAVAWLLLLRGVI